jgi:hypothetical protein
LGEKWAKWDTLLCVGSVKEPEIEDKPKPEMTRKGKNKPQLCSEAANMTKKKKKEEATRNKQDNCKKINV